MCTQGFTVITPTFVGTRMLGDTTVVGGTAGLPLLLRTKCKNKGECARSDKGFSVAHSRSRHTAQPVGKVRVV